MKKVITFSLWGNLSQYTAGAIKNVELAFIYFPDFECWFYIHDQSVPKSLVSELEKYSNVKIIKKSGDINTCKPMMWRFEAIDDPDVEIMMSRDLDTRIYMREQIAVNEWIASGELFHIMRDHPYHSYPIQGGMFGTRKNHNIPIWIDLMNKVSQTGNRDYDQDFLRDIIYPIVRQDALVHATFNILPYEKARPFPTDYDSEYHFVGEYVYEDGTRNQEHINMIKQHLGK